MALKSLRGAITEAVKNDAEHAISSIRKSGVDLDALEAEAIKSGNLDVFSDRHLAKRFSAKVLGALGINASDFSSNVAQGEESSDSSEKK